MYGETLDFQCQHQQRWQERVLTANLPQKWIFRSDTLCYHYWCRQWKFKSLHTLFDKYLDHMLVKFEQNCMVGTIQNFEFFDKKWLTIFDKVLTPVWKMFLLLEQLFAANYWFKDYHLSVFQKFPGGTQLWVGYGCAARSFDHHSIGLTKPEKMQICNLCLKPFVSWKAL